MANIFPRSANLWLLKIGLSLTSLAVLILMAIWYYFTPRYTRVGYEPQQPIAFSHGLHMDQLGMDCRYCHSFVDEAAHANIPTTQTCYNCHRPGGVRWDSPKLAVLRESIEQNKPIRWVQVHQLPDYVYFNHSVHFNRGIHCSRCHGKDIRFQQVISQVEPLSMGFCLECHRHPEKYILPIFTLPYPTGKPNPKNQDKTGQQLVSEWNVHPPTNCSGCHR